MGRRGPSCWLCGEVGGWPVTVCSSLVRVVSRTSATWERRWLRGPERGCQARLHVHAPTRVGRLALSIRSCNHSLRMLPPQVEDNQSEQSAGLPQRQDSGPRHDPARDCPRSRWPQGPGTWARVARDCTEDRMQRKALLWRRGAQVETGGRIRQLSGESGARVHPLVVPLDLKPHPKRS